MRVYTISPTSALTVTTTRELLTFKVPTGKIVWVFKAHWTTPTSENSQQLETHLRLLSADATGSTTGISVFKHDPGDAAHGLTNIWKDSTLGTVATDGLIVPLADDIRVGWQDKAIPEILAELVGGNVVSMSLMEAPGASLTIQPAFVIGIRG